MSDTAATTWLTQESFDRLSAELEHLSGPARVEIAKKIEAAREEGDLKENGGYHGAEGRRVDHLYGPERQADQRRGRRGRDLPRLKIPRGREEVDLRKLVSRRYASMRGS